ncbi:cysteine desulfurase [Acetobacterium wieringae]|uniref:cysteine desulfurase n=1 Tax=Acetobacterium wieringae TaxID=52694 RepID=A0ABY6HA20_9FIRM|nr:cysteine desulfurase family protein [Acetobacterium wieringae]UYO61170.1 cysteine desulfurase [Acetobacterium wieringae]VUZ24428.1 Cysteine desulfurase IscS [Acetobacterium wieringae]
MIYADNAATTRMDNEAFEAMKPFLLENFGNASQPYSFSRAAKKAIKQARSTIAECIAALPEEIYFTSGGTESDNWAVKGSTLLCGDLSETITSEIEHHAILNTCKTIERLGFPVSYLTVDSAGIIKPDILREKVSPKTKLVTIMLANNEIGTIQPIQELCSIAHENGCLFHTDAVQAVGHIEIDVKKLNVDMLSASAHKFNGPKGIGFLYIKKGTNLPPYLDGGLQEFGIRAGTENIASIVAMGVALRNNVKNIDQRYKELKKLENILISELSKAKIDFIRNGTSLGLPGNVNLSFRDVEGEMLLHRLDLLGICVSTGSACDSKRTQISHVIKALRIPDVYGKGTLRISFGKDNNEHDALRIAKELIRIINLIA